MQHRRLLPPCAVLALLAAALPSGCGSQDRSMSSKSYDAGVASAPRMEVAQASVADQDVALRGDMAAKVATETGGERMIRREEMNRPGAPAVAQAPPSAEAMARKIIYTATVNLVTEKLNEVTSSLLQQVKAHEGYVAETNISGATGSQREATWKVRVPAHRFDAFMQAVGTLGEMQNSATTSQDVSEEFYDIAARLKNKRVEEARLIQHLQRSTAKLQEILEVEREISRVREEIERMEGRLRFLSNQTDFSTVTITVREIKDYVPPSPPTFATEIMRSFSGSVETMVAFAKGLVLLIVALAPWALPIGLLVAGLIRWDRKRRRTGYTNRQ